MAVLLAFPFKKMNTAPPADFPFTVCGYWVKSGLHLKEFS
jgi:hypothetical protein